MPQYKVRPGFKLVVSHPDQPGATIDMVGGEVVELSEEMAAQYPAVLDPYEPVKAEPVSVQAPEPTGGQ